MVEPSSPNWEAVTNHFWSELPLQVAIAFHPSQAGLLHSLPCSSTPCLGLCSSCSPF